MPPCTMEMISFVELKAIVLGKRGSTGNCMTSRWVLRFKRKENEKIIKARLTVHGFKHVDADNLSTYVATASKWTQRLVLAIASQIRWELIFCRHVQRIHPRPDVARNV